MSHVSAARSSANGLRAAVLVSAILAVTSQSAFNAPVSGSGTPRCAEWTRLRTFADQTGHAKELVSLQLVQAWIEGFISGVRSESGQPDLLTSKEAIAALYPMVDSYCKASPVDTVGDATMELVKELRKRARR
ncbi:MAG TPA: hypothetical protein VKG24_23040 [Pseudolabrys sp.]|jgi:hypothetical protein|nr:hypothetical protein [Pseudolabrys sp.]